MNAVETINKGEETIDQWSEMRFGKDGMRDKSFDSSDETDDASEVFSSSAALVFMGATEKDRVRKKRRFNEQSASSFRPVKLVSANGNHIGIELVNVFKRLLAEPLDSVGVEENAPFLTQSAQLGNRLNGADFIISGHDRNENGVGSERAFKHFGFYNAFSSNR